MKNTKKMRKQKKAASKKARKSVRSPSTTTSATTKKSENSENAKVRPLGDRILIKEMSSQGEQMVSGIIVPVSEDKSSDFKKGIVVAVGPGKYDDGILIPPGVKKGDRVLFSWGDKVKIDSEELYLVKESEISAIFS